MTSSRLLRSRVHRAGTYLAVMAAGLGLGACDTLLDVELPDRIPIEKIDDVTLAPVLARGVIGDFECAYNNYSGGTAVHSDEYETSNGNVPLSNWGERNLGADEDDYAIGGCEAVTAGGSNFGLQVPMHTARYQSEDIFNRLSAFTDAEVPNRSALLASVKTYGAYTYTLFGEVYCSIAFDGGPEQTPAQSSAIAETRFNEAIALAQTAGSTDLINMARVGLARARMDLKKWPEAATTAALVTAGYEKFADRGTENDRRWNKIYYLATQLGAYVISDQYRAITDPRVPVRNEGRDSFTPGVTLWITTKYAGQGSPIRLASYREAQLILAEAQAQQSQVGAAMTTLNARRTELGLPDLTATTKDEAVAAVLSERQRDLFVEGGHRLNDILRYHLPWKGANGSTVNANPYSGRPYGNLTCFPIPTKELSGA